MRRPSKIVGVTPEDVRSTFPDREFEPGEIDEIIESLQIFAYISYRSYLKTQQKGGYRGE